MSTDCDLLAASLQHNYLATSPFVPGNNIHHAPIVPPPTTKASDNDSLLKEYLSNHGVLFTMCEPVTCDLLSGSNHVSATWVNQQVGFNWFPMSNMGYILDPMAIDDISCIFPGDAATRFRDDLGCGPFMIDEQWGSRGATRITPEERLATIEKLKECKTNSFPDAKDWKDLDCKEFFQAFTKFDKNALLKKLVNWFDPTSVPGGETCSIDMDKVILEDFWVLLKDSYSAILGQDVCTLSKQTTETVTTSTSRRLGSAQKEKTRVNELYTYAGSCSFTPMHWNDMISTQFAFQSRLNEGEPNFNEVVVALNDPKRRSIRDWAKAIFYIVTPDMTEDEVIHARLQAFAESQLDKKPVIQANLNALNTDAPIFHCDSGNE